MLENGNMIIKCPKCNKEFDLKGKPASIICCPYCGCSIDRETGQLIPQFEEVKETIQNFQPVSRQTPQYPCLLCSRPMEYIKEYNQWYCPNCRKYASEMPNYPCPTCGKPLRFIPKYQRWFCDYCQRYS